MKRDDEAKSTLQNASGRERRKQAREGMETNTKPTIVRICFFVAFLVCCYISTRVARCSLFGLVSSPCSSSSSSFPM
jgi:hypothetical protein